MLMARLVGLDAMRRLVRAVRPRTARSLLPLLLVLAVLVQAAAVLAMVCGERRAFLDERAEVQAGQTLADAAPPGRDGDEVIDLRAETWLAAGRNTVRTLMVRDGHRIVVESPAAGAPGGPVRVSFAAARLSDRLRQAALAFSLLSLLACLLVGAIAGAAAAAAKARLRHVTETLHDSERRAARLDAAKLAYAKFSHDLRGCLSTPLLAADRLRTSPDASMQRLGEAISRALERATALIRAGLSGLRDDP